MASYVQGDCLIDYTPGSAVAAGEVVVIGSVVAVAPRPIAANALGAVAVEGVWSMSKNAGIVIGAGDKVYYYATSGAVTGATGTAAGFAVAAAASGDTSVKVALVPLC
jgi:predicted RecA/RadA family phage recombinase